MSPIPVGFRDFLHEIGPMTRNPERDTERSRVVRARSPSLLEAELLSLIKLSTETLDEYIEKFDNINSISIKAFANGLVL